MALKEISLRPPPPHYDQLCPAWRDLSLSCNVVSVWEQIPNARRLSRIILVAQGAFIDRTVDVLSPVGLERIDSSIPVQQLG